MNLLNLVIKEFISIVESLEDTEPITNERIVIEREQFKTLLEKYKYLTFKEKTNIYKTLNLIIHDKNNYTMPCKESGKTIRKVVINYHSYIVLKHLYESKV